MLHVPVLAKSRCLRRRQTLAAVMGKKERSFDPNQAFRKEQKKAEAKKV